VNATKKKLHEAPGKPVRNGGKNGVGGGNGGAAKNQAATTNPITTPWTPRKLHETVRADTTQEYRPTERAINAEKRASVKRTGELGGWWKEYLGSVAAGQAEGKAAYADAAAQGQGQISEASTQDNANTARLSAEAATSAAARGQTAPTQPAERGAAAQAQRNYLSADYGATTAERGANQNVYLGEQKRIGVGQSIAARMNEQSRTRKIESDKRELAKQRGDYATKDTAEREEAQRDYRIKLNAYGLEGKKFKAEQATATAAAKTAGAQQGLENRQKQEEIEIERQKAAKEGGLTPSEKRERGENTANARAAATSLYKTGYKVKNKKGNYVYNEWPSWDALAQAVAQESEVSPAAARAAVKKLREGVEKQKRDAANKSINSGGPPLAG
jgi:hypothetical protein